MKEARIIEGRKFLSVIEGSDGASIVETMRDVAPDLAKFAIEFVYGDLYSRSALPLRERQLATVAALAAMGNTESQLRFHIAGALNVGCSPAEVVELMIHLVVYAGFPAALNGTTVAKAVFQARGLEATPRATPSDATLPDPSRYTAGWSCMNEVDGHLGEKVINSMKEVAPDLGRFIVEFAFGDIYTRPGLDLFARELVTVAALTAMGNAPAQLKVHMNGFLNVGGTAAQLVEIVTHIAGYAGFPRAISGALAAKEVMAERAREGG